MNRVETIWIGRIFMILSSKTLTLLSRPHQPQSRNLLLLLDDSASKLPSYPSHWSQSKFGELTTLYPVSPQRLLRLLSRLWCICFLAFFLFRRLNLALFLSSETSKNKLSPDRVAPELFCLGFRLLFLFRVETYWWSLEIYQHDQLSQRLLNQTLEKIALMLLWCS